ncbi:MAG: GTP cyclohydrolase II RibA [Rhodomicrobium sp.]
MESEMPLDYFGDARQVAVERALSEFRAARPVAIQSGAGFALACPAEGLTEKQIPFLQAAGRNARLIIPGEKVRPAAAWEEAAAAVRLDPLTLETIEAYVSHETGGGANGACVYSAVLSAPNQACLAALALANLSLLLPAVIVAEVSAADLERLPVLAVEAQDVIQFRDREAKSLKIIARTFVPLEGAGQCEFAVFRGGDGFRDQIAVIVGDPSPKRPVLARIHSACLTGDLFGSLKCDCGDQLRGTVRAMAEQGGGIVLYLDQEGRGNGIANKIRAYCLQEEGFDTYDADELLGFGQDQRRFDFAAEMLMQLGFTSVRLMTNNPRKIAALREAGLEVVSTHRVLARQTAHNAKYLAAKRDKGGHLLGDAALDGMDIDDLLRPATPQS